MRTMPNMLLALRAFLKIIDERVIAINCLVVMISVNIKAPNFCIVTNIKICPTPLAIDNRST